MEQSAAASRAARIVVRRFASAAEADRYDREYWLSIPAPDRLLQVWRLSADLWTAWTLADLVPEELRGLV